MALKKSSPSNTIDDITTEKCDDGCYLQLRSRRVERRIGPIGKKTKKIKGKHVDLQKGKVGIFGDNEHESENKERYNFDPVNDKPLKGRYEWEELEDMH
ncbi:hypothetical protein DH2020_005205 [Rehmannia glutinosa]|uniref:Cyclin-dependent kinase inhibitor domain-containing protein n=1 Tax=Rehmannia glutinosa TaxID=99300 RepID=A0ABR0XRK8_REHGL